MIGEQYRPAQQFPVRMRQLLRERKMKQKELAGALGYCNSSVSAWGTGRYQPSLDALSDLADLFQVSVDWLLGRTDER